MIGPSLEVLGGGQSHHLGRRTALLQQLGHGLHRRAGVREEQLQALAEVVLARLAVARNCEAVLRATAVTQGLNLATPALSGKRIALVVSEFALLRPRQ